MLRKSLLAVLALIVSSHVARAQRRVLRFTDLSAAQIGKLDRARTVLVIPGGIIEEHGPYLPTGSDGVRNDRIASDIASAIAARPGWTAVLLPPVPLGSGPFNQVAQRPEFPGSIAVRASTLRAVFSDYADAIGAQGFRWVFIVNGHGDPNHNRALDDAGDYFHATYGGTMIHLLGRAGCQPESIEDGGVPERLLSAAASKADADSPHAGAVESARTWVLAPTHVDSAGLLHARDVTAPMLGDWRRASAQRDWPGYVGAPRFATRALGQWEMARESRACSALALRILDGADESKIPRYADRMLAIPPLKAAVDSILGSEAAQGARQDAWRANAPKRP